MNRNRMTRWARAGLVLGLGIVTLTACAQPAPCPSGAPQQTHPAQMQNWVRPSSTASPSDPWAGQVPAQIWSCQMDPDGRHWDVSVRLVNHSDNLNRSFFSVLLMKGGVQTGDSLNLDTGWLDGNVVTNWTGQWFGTDTGFTCDVVPA